MFKSIGSFILLSIVVMVCMVASASANATQLFELQGVKYWINTNINTLNFVEPLQKSNPTTLAGCNHKIDVLRTSTLQSPKAVAAMAEEHSISDPNVVISYASPVRKAMTDGYTHAYLDSYQLVLSAQCVPIDPVN